MIDKRLELGFSVVIRDDDYRKIYRDAAAPRRSRKDTKYGVCFRACLAFVLSYIASELKLMDEAARPSDLTVNFVLQHGRPHADDARRPYDLFKSDTLPEWQDLVGTFDVSEDNSPGLQAADLLAYSVYRMEMDDHEYSPSAIEVSLRVATPIPPVNKYPRAPIPEKGPMVFRIPNCVYRHYHPDHLRAAARDIG